jgi:AraC family transcriptional regulator of adaptative response / DNA-3-methyladenine glycosylase II
VISKAFHADSVLQRTFPEDLGIRIPGSWDPFELAVRAILGQQVSVAVATAAAERMVERLGPGCQGAPGLTRVFPSPQILLQADLTGVGVGLTRAKAETIRAFAEAVCGQQICFAGIVDLDEFRARLLAIPGIGRWTSEYVAMRALRDPDAFPSGDLELRQRLGNCTARELEQRSQAWRPWRAYAAMLLWQGGSVEKPRIARKIA